jgi:hypothetical protein
VISPGYQIYPAADGSWRYATPGEKFVRISGPDRLLRMVQEMAAGASVASEDTAPALGELVAALRQRGVLAAEPAPRPPSHPGRVHVAGENPVAAAVAAALRPHAEVTTGAVDEDAVAGTQVLVSAAGWLPDARWRQIDQWCAEHRTAWHRVHAEGTRFALGPFFLPGRTAGYADTRARRLAACPVADELLELWRFLDGDDPKPPVRWPRSNLLASLVVEDVLRWLDGEDVPSLGHQLLVDPDTAEISRHPVLPLPAVAERPAALSRT